jgi:hypothetical protein
MLAQYLSFKCQARGKEGKAKGRETYHEAHGEHGNFNVTGIRDALEPV